MTARNWEAMYGALLGFCRGFVLLGWAGLQCPPCIFARCVGARVKPLPLKTGSEQSLSPWDGSQTTILAASWSRRPVVLIDKDRRG